MAKLTQRLGLTRYEADEAYKKALEAYNRRKLDEAIPAMDEAIGLLPNSAEYYAARGFFYLEDDVDDKAEADFIQALRIYPYEMLAHYGLGVIAYKAKNWDAAQVHFINAYKANPKRAETLYYLALVYHRQGQNGLAHTFMQQATTAFESAGDKKRGGDAGKWAKTLEKLAAEQAPKLPQGS
jgi:tetratricopeptide (TPR) repeat protein